MATPEQQQLLSLAEEATCPICLGYFTDPVFVQCGHTFCTPCITRYWEGEGLKGGPYPCPQCRETAPTNILRPNRHLASIVQILAQGAPSREGPFMCPKHDEKLKLFCQEDQTPICVICRESRGHRAHTVTPILEAAQEYKEKVKIQRAQITSVFNKMQQFLEKEKCRHLSNLEEKTKRTLQEIREKVTELNKQQASARDQITAIESKCQQSGVELLKDVKNILSRYEDLISPNPPPGVFDGEEKKTEKNEIKKKEEEEGEKDLEKKIIESLELRWARSFAGEVTLDPDTAHQHLVLSEDGRSVRYGDTAPDLPDTPERFSRYLFVLGRERLSSGRHYWEVDIGDNTEWRLGVCDEFVTLKGNIMPSPERGYWTVRFSNGKYVAITSPQIFLTPSAPPRVVGVFLDFEAGRLSLYNVPDRSLLFTFSRAYFPRTLLPLFCPGHNDGGENAGVLRVLTRTGQERE